MPVLGGKKPCDFAGGNETCAFAGRYENLRRALRSMKPCACAGRCETLCLFYEYEAYEIFCLF